MVQHTHPDLEMAVHGGVGDSYHSLPDWTGLHLQHGLQAGLLCTVLWPQDECRQLILIEVPAGSSHSVPVTMPPAQPCL